MTVLFTAIVIIDGWLDGSLTTQTEDDKSVQGTILCILIAVLIIPAQLELSKLAKAKNLTIFTVVSTIASILFASTWYWPQLIRLISVQRSAFTQFPVLYLFFLSVFSLASLLLSQYIHYGSQGLLSNCGVSYFSIVYLGLLPGFMLGIRIHFGLWAFLMFIFVVKGSDIAAYAIGTLFGSHKFAPEISPAKTWEGGLAGLLTAITVALFFAHKCGIMVWWLAVMAGVCFAVIAQAGDLVESMIKRDAQQKDSANKVPGFGGVLDIVDSPLLVAPFAYLFFLISS